MHFLHLQKLDQKLRYFCQKELRNDIVCPVMPTWHFPKAKY